MEQTSFHQENFRRRTRYTAVFLILAAVFCVVTVLNINTGNVYIPVPKILRILFLKEGAATEYNIIWKIRLPRILMAALLGGALSLSGFLLQTFFSNPIAGPFVLGISSGAKMVVALTMIVYLKYIGRFSSYTLILAAFIGSLISTGFILLMSKKVQHMASLLVGGIMIGYICSAITDFVVTFADDSDIVNLHGWSQGSFSGMSWSNIRVAAVVVGLAVLFTFFLSKPISAYQLGEAYAQSMGVNIKTFRVILILLSSILSACVTAFAGPISFVGIAVPFLARKAFGTSKPIVVIPGTFFMGAVFCMICDLIARMALAPVELNISTVTSILGAPIVIYMMIPKGGRK
ncbi:FecCD family ABC transporter permease [Mediterraneibacter faecis]|jgi:iron complex transport system permease protein|uniref:FecCD family ABC transporter permease n=1 Tax=Mediterraneibacter faecis TaxID=592978 RepID=UPI0006CFEDF4|nr:iron ABC transporter permease [Mediterraneibacter faecis]RGG28057.1 iron ABC transporter permease [Ruminococcus sp. AF25-17]RGI24373.1 iron ABC transporter permease [Ruminococcus sp. OM08-13AT]RGI52738.1 iron ABC transporter permease [Ruminococcus sp. OF05-2BH]